MSNKGKEGFLSKAKKSLPETYTYWFEPDDPIMNKKDFTNELIRYCDKNHKDLIILKEGMEPVVQIDGKQYLCMLEQPRSVNFAGSFFFMAKTYGFKFVYIYPYDAEISE